MNVTFVRYYTECCEYGLELAIEHYKEMLPHFYSNNYHEQKIHQSMIVLLKHGRGIHLDWCKKKLTHTCNEIWLNGREQCETLSLRGNPCVMPKHEILSNDGGHSSGETIISTCNCGRTQAIRADPYTLRHANYEFYQIIMNSCSACPKLETISFAIFEPSINDYRLVSELKSCRFMMFEEKLMKIILSHLNSAAEVEKPHLEAQKKDVATEDDEDADYQVLSMPSQLANLNLSIGSGLSLSDNRNDQCQDDAIENEHANDENSSDHEVIAIPSDDDANDSESVNEIVVRVGGEENEEPSEKCIFRQPSTTEYLSGMIHTMTPSGLLPQYPHWSLVCVGHSSVYSHSSGERYSISKRLTCFQSKILFHLISRSF